MTEERTITVTVNATLADAFEAHAHLLAPARLIGEVTTTNPFWRTYQLAHPHALAGASAAVPVLQRTTQDGAPDTVTLLGWEWYDAHGRALAAPPGHVPAQ